ncbi:indole-3-glycerol phosphate synthase TrpC [Oenococcus sp. UCMA 14587]|nr:indole-3-glycerol phosphate synthase TrpC [Oenococcus sp. UCMA 14587]
MILDDLVAATTLRIEKEQKKIPLKKLKAQVSELAINRQFPFELALKQNRLGFICEIKQASPSKGKIVNHLDYLQIAKDYQAAGANAISVLTEPTYFHGSLDYLREVHKVVSLPLLRKDFTISRYMIYQAKAAGASAILLIVGILSDLQLKEYLSIADQLGLSAIVEAHNPAEIKRALIAKARIIGVNNRNLKDFTVDLTTSLHLRKLVPKNVLFVSESGIQTATDIANLKKAGVNAVLIGETMMRAKDKIAALEKLQGDDLDED